MGNPSRGEMGRLLTREIKSSRDGEYLCAHLHTPREDASSQAAAAKSHFSRLLSREPFVCTEGKTIRAPLGHSPGSPLPAGPNRLLPSPMGTGAGPENLPAAATVAAGQPPGHLSRLQGGKPHFLKPGTNFLSEAPVLSRGWTRVLGAVAAGRGARRTAATTTESQSGPV